MTLKLVGNIEKPMPVKAFIERNRLSSWSTFRRLPISEQQVILSNAKDVQSKEKKALECLMEGNLPETFDRGYNDYFGQLFAAKGLKDAGLCASLIEHAMNNNFHGKYMEFLVDKMTELVSGPVYSGWSHCVCHWFESPESGDQFYAVGRNDLVGKLMEASVKGAVAQGKLECTGRTLHGLIFYNLMHINPKSLDEPLALPFPESLRDPAFISLVAREFRCSAPPTKMMAAKTQKEFILAMLEEYPQYIIKRPGGLRHGLKITEDALESLMNLVPEIGEERVNYYFQELAHDSRITLESAITNVKSLCTDEMLEGYYVDIDGTLIVNGRLNVELIRWLEVVEKRGVKIVSGGNPVDQEERLKALLKESGIETTIRVQVGSKEELKGKRVEHLIDDTPPTIQGFDAIRWFKPDEIVNE